MSTPQPTPVASTTTIIPPVIDDDLEIVATDAPGQLSVEAPVDAPPTIETTVAPAAAPAESPAAKPEYKSAKNIEAMARQRRQQLEREKLAADRAIVENDRKAVAAERERVVAEQKRIEQFNTDVAAAKSNPEALIAKYGLTYDDLTKARLNGGELSAEAKLKVLAVDLAAVKEGQAAVGSTAAAQLEELKQQLAAEKEANRVEAEKRDLERSQAEQARLLTGHLERIKTNVKAETHPAVCFLPDGAGYKAVQDEIMAHWKATKLLGSPVALTDSQAADVVEKKMRSNLEKHAGRLGPERGAKFLESIFGTPAEATPAGKGKGTPAAPTPAAPPAPKYQVTGRARQVPVGDKSDARRGTHLHPWSGQSSYEQFKAEREARDRKGGA